MEIDFQFKAKQLLEKLANSIHDRDTKNSRPFFFKIDEISVAEKWLKEFIEELKTP